MDPNNGSPQILMPIPNRATIDMRATGARDLPQAHASAQYESESVASDGKIRTERIHAAAPELVRPTAMDTLDRDLWAAGQSIAASRRERMAIYHALNDASAAWTGLERSAAATRKKYDQAKLEYQQLMNHYQALYEQHERLQERHNHACVDLARALEDQRRLQTVAITLEDQNALNDTLKLELREAKDELAALKDWKSQELRSRDLIDKLQ